jgi:uncharacterized ion transporter superfamily protein YfcC
MFTNESYLLIVLQFAIHIVITLVICDGLFSVLKNHLNEKIEILDQKNEKMKEQIEKFNKKINDTETHLKLIFGVGFYNIKKQMNENLDNKIRALINDNILKKNQPV